MTRKPEAAAIPDNTMPKSILFYAKAPMNVVMFKPLVERLRHDPAFGLHFCGHAAAGLTLRQIYDQGGLPSVKLTPIWWAKLRRWDLYISPDKMLVGRRARCKAQIYHGVSFKGRMYDRSILSFDKLFLIGEDMRRRYVQRAILTEDDPRAERIGMPKTDRLLDGTLQRDNYLRALGLDPALKTFLFAPTWRPESSLYSMGRQIMSQMTERLPVNLLVKLHDLVMDPATNPVDWRKELPAFEKGNVRVVRDLDVIPAMHASDALISDASSVANEFLLLNRPIIFIDVPALFERYRDSIDLGGWGRRTGLVVESFEDLVAAANRSIEFPDELADIRREAAADIFYHPGEATNYAVAAIRRILSR